ncbi:MobQ family relaxase [Aeromonas jandaei]
MRCDIAIYHCSVKTFSRRNGQSATAAAAYRAGEKLLDEQTGELHDYRKKGGVISATLILPKDAPAWASDRGRLWNEVERAETRINSTVAREFEIALPQELPPNDRERLAQEFARELVERHGFVADVAIHAPPEFKKDDTGKVIDNQNHHAHILLSTRRLGPEDFTEKTREFDARSKGDNDDAYLFGPSLVEHWRERFALLQNQYLERAGVAARVDHRSNKTRGLDAEPTRHLGPAAVGFERRTGIDSEKRKREVLAVRAVDEREQALDAAARELAELDAQEAVIAAELAEDQRYVTMDDAELSEVISNIHPTDIDRQVESSWEVSQAKRAVTDLESKHDSVARQIESWEESHRFKTWLNSKGIGGAELDGLRTGLAQLGNRITKALRKVRKVTEAAHDRLWPEYNRRLILFDELIELRKAKRQRKEQQVEAAQSLEFSTIALQRSMGVFGWADGGKEWNACPKALQRLIEGYLSAPEGEREALSAEMGRSADVRYWLAQQKRGLDPVPAPERNRGPRLG